MTGTCDPDTLNPDWTIRASSWARSSKSAAKPRLVANSLVIPSMFGSRQRPDQLGILEANMCGVSFDPASTSFARMR
eukprot:CAMPEP_0183336100 /NCGR_PEP_ID=MMETSP0164_2-20130417/4185_1 /TAXON_ID=221442 /ORGANISM="Coccolithus pelagicus ssp braarudi, Strain PLY182g" /LENGTH=76 /DNA_ID=CAMNT_0025505565 /DNA_START=393 /DNA_END=623 /DNA_ORIENTATION=+